jgi:hypothetical protein
MNQVKQLTNRLAEDTHILIRREKVILPLLQLLAVCAALSGLIALSVIWVFQIL